ncbi:hypothetical protein C8Q76DRAFT_217433 [Earliella scabrosa]|nr:hypothetical protein C8Q76DRAFT_217433 [Earliella scabrosa]
MCVFMTLQATATLAGVARDRRSSLDPLALVPGPSHMDRIFTLEKRDGGGHASGCGYCKSNGRMVEVDIVRVSAPDAPRSTHIVLGKVAFAELYTYDARQDSRTTCARASLSRSAGNRNSNRTMAHTRRRQPKSPLAWITRSSLASLDFSMYLLCAYGTLPIAYLLRHGHEVLRACPALRLPSVEPCSILDSDMSKSLKHRRLHTRLAATSRRASTFHHLCISTSSTKAPGAPDDSHPCFSCPDSYGPPIPQVEYRYGHLLSLGFLTSFSFVYPSKLRLKTVQHTGVTPLVPRQPIVEIRYAPQSTVGFELECRCSPV